MKDINLLPSFINKKNDGFKAIKIIVGILLIMSILVTAASVFFIEQELAKMDETKAEIQREIDELRVVETLEAELNTKKSEFEKVLAVIERFEEKTILNYKLLQDITKSLPKDAFLLDYEVTQSKKMVLNGASKSQKDAVYFVCALKELPLVKQVEIKSIVKIGEKSESYNFFMEIEID